MKRITAVILLFSFCITLFASSCRAPETSVVETTLPPQTTEETTETTEPTTETTEPTSITDEQHMAAYKEWELKDSEPYENWTEKPYAEEDFFETSEEKYFKSFQPPENITEDYTELKKELQKVIRYRGYTGDSKQIVIDTFHALYNNYSSWESAYRDFPSKEKYIRKNYVDVLKKTDIECYISGSKEFKEESKEWGCEVYTGMTIEEDGTYKIFMVLSPKEEESAYLRYCATEEFFHEVTHCRTYTGKGVDDMDYSGYMYMEGSTTFHEKFTTIMDYIRGGSWPIGKADESVLLEYHKTNCIGYLTLLSMYEKLVFLLGFDTIWKFEHNEITYETIGKMLTKKYGKPGTEVLLLLNRWGREYEETEPFGEKIFKLSVDVENKFLECLEKEISDLRTKEDVDEFIRLYDHYKKRNMPVTTNKNYQVMPTIFNVESVEKVLKTKAKEFGISYTPAEIEIEG